jgi:hypothetical protein
MSEENKYTQNQKVDLISSMNKKESQSNTTVKYPIKQKR